MENQHRLVKGYRELDETEIALMNTVKALGATIENLIDKIAIHQQMQRVPNLSGELSARSAEQQRLDAAEPERWLAMGRSDLQTGLMKLTRAVTQPGFF